MTDPVVSSLDTLAEQRHDEARRLWAATGWTPSDRLIVHRSWCDIPGLIGALRAAVTERDQLRADARDYDDGWEVGHDAARDEIAAAEGRVRQLEAENNALESERQRLTVLGAQWAQEREDAREQLGREMATVDDMARDVAAAEAQVARVRREVDVLPMKSELRTALRAALDGPNAKETNQPKENQ